MFLRSRPCSDSLPALSTSVKAIGWHRMVPFVRLGHSIAVGWSWQMLDCLLILFSATISPTPLCLFSLSNFFLGGATSLVLQKQSQILHVLHLQPSSRTFLKSL